MDEPLRALDLSDISLHTNDPENDTRRHAIEREISAGTRSEAGRDVRDAFLGLIKKCREISVSPFGYLGCRLHVEGGAIAPPFPQITLAA